MKKTVIYKFIKLWCIFSIIIVSLMIFSIFFYILIKGIKSLNLEFIFDTPKGTPLGSEGGIFPAIIGSIYLLLVSCLVATTLGISTSIYLVFYCKNSHLKYIFNLIISSISGIPSIILGLFGYTFLVYHLELGRSLLSGGITLGIMILPYIQVQTEKILTEIPSTYIHSSYALGVSKSYTIFNIILPLCLGNIISTVILSGSFAMGAAAPIIMTAAVINAPVPKNIFSPVMALPYHLYILIGEGISTENAYGTALILIILLLLINFLASSISKLFSKIK